MNWIKDLIPNIKRNFSQTLGDKDSKVPRAYGVHAIVVDQFCIFLS